MLSFVGRRRELGELDLALAQVQAEAAAGAGRGCCLILHGRRRIGKSALVEEFLRLSGVPHVFYTAEIGASTDQPLLEFVRAVRESSLPEAGIFEEATPGNWAAALRQLAGILP